MHSRSLARRAIPATVTLAFVIASATVFAQDNGSQEVRIQGAPVVTSEGWSHTGIQDQRVMLSQNISYADLNLATPAGERELKSRVRDAANTICQRLGDYDQSNRGVDAQQHQVECVDGALDDAMVQVRRALAPRLPGK
jgi:UrcA family protein